ncbi:hypothetical protein ACT7DA_12240 [Bacillus pacificus]
MHPVAAEIRVHVNSILKQVTQNFAVLQTEFQFDVKLGDRCRHVSIPSSYAVEQIIIIVLDNAVKCTKEVNNISCIESGVQSRGLSRIIDCIRRAGIPEADLPFVLNRFIVWTKQEVENKVETV